MKTIETKVQEKTNNGEWPVTLTVPENLTEMVEIYGQDVVYELALAQLKIKMQAVARESFKKNESRETVEALLAEYKPGRIGRTSLKNRAVTAMMMHGAELKEDNDKMQRVINFFSSADYKKVLVELGEMTAEEAAAPTGDDENGED